MASYTCRRSRWPPSASSGGSHTHPPRDARSASDTASAPHAQPARPLLLQPVVVARRRRRRRRTEVRDGDVRAEAAQREREQRAVAPGARVARVQVVAPARARRERRARGRRQRLLEGVLGPVPSMARRAAPRQPQDVASHGPPPTTHARRHTITQTKQRQRRRVPALLLPAAQQAPPGVGAAAVLRRELLHHGLPDGEPGGLGALDDEPLWDHQRLEQVEALVRLLRARADAPAAACRRS
eukprot:scaffold2236_cov385-Prasinococcus_capsulatus_cf.AAC.1